MNIIVMGDYTRFVEEEIIEEFERKGHHVHPILCDVSYELDEHLLDKSEDVYKNADIAVDIFIRDSVSRSIAIRELESRLPPNTLFLTATHTATATQMAEWCLYNGRVVGFTAISPFINATVVELMPALQSDPAMVEKAQEFWRSIGREPVTVADSVGGVLPRVVCNLINEAAYALMEGVATPADIDRAMQLGTNHPRGPLAWADLIGIPQVVAILEALGREFGTAQYHPAPLLKQYARAGRGFYE